MSNMEGDALTKWNSDNRRLVDAALAIQKIRDGLEEGGDE